MGRARTSKSTKIDWDAGVMIPVQLCKSKSIEEGWNQIVRARAYLDEDTGWNLIFTEMVKDMGMEMTPVPASVGWNFPNFKNKSGGQIKIVGTGVASIMRLGTDWKAADWVVCSGMDTPVLLKKETWSFSMDTMRGPQWWEKLQTCQYPLELP